MCVGSYAFTMSYRYSYRRSESSNHNEKAIERTERESTANGSFSK